MLLLLTVDIHIAIVYQFRERQRARNEIQPDVERFEDRAVIRLIRRSEPA
jgi:hypothetical protein